MGVGELVDVILGVRHCLGGDWLGTTSLDEDFNKRIRGGILLEKSNCGRIVFGYRCWFKEICKWANPWGSQLVYDL